MSFIAMNRFRIRPGAEDAFEEMWRSRESRLKEVAGFQEFRLLKGPAGKDHVLYSSHVVWASKEAFEGWTKSQAFRDAHKNAGDESTRDVMLGPPDFEGFETVLFES